MLQIFGFWVMASLLYVLTSVAVALLFAEPPGYASPIWPAAGVALLSVMLGGYRLLPAVGAGSLLVNLWIASQQSTSLTSQGAFIAAWIGVGAMLQALVGAWLLSRWTDNAKLLVGSRSVLLFVLLAGPISCLVNSTWSVLLLTASGITPWSRFLVNWLNWYVGDAIGVLLVLLIVLPFCRSGAIWRQRIWLVSLPMAGVTLAVSLLFLVAQMQERERLTDEVVAYAEATESQLETLLDGVIAGQRGLANHLREAAENNRARSDELSRFIFDAHPCLGEVFVVKCDPKEPKIDYRYPPQEATSPVFSSDWLLAAQETLRRQVGMNLPTPVTLPVPPSEPDNERVCYLAEPIYRLGAARETAAERERALWKVVVLRVSLSKLLQKGGEVASYHKVTSRWLQPTAGQEPKTGVRWGNQGCVVVSKIDRGPITGFIEYSAGLEFLAWQQSRHLGGILLLGMFLVALIGTLLLATTGETAAVSEHVQQKTEALRAETEERLRLESRMLASQRLESLGVLTGSIAHEFNNLLAVIMGNTELVRSEILDAESQECLEQILLASRKAAERCRQMLAYAGQGRFAFAVVDLRQVTLDAKRAITRPGNVTIGVDFEDNFPMIDADEPQIRQLITSMLQNAIEAYGEREGTVQVRVGTMMFADVNKEDLVASERNFQKVVFVEVRDWGCGMDEEVRQRIFEPFFSTKFPGRGMGLAASLGIVRGHRGAMSVWSRVGEGSIFRIYFAAREEIGKKTPPAFKSVPLQAT